ncbi:hypothetical protein EV401DRAFT_2084232 [Pisolithus croceorrhizus]|nr:hypothetical protein EV401DRAFT_2084232 [Pisolithus croceorrhizus]
MLAVSAIQSDSNDDEAVAKAKYEERQHQKKAHKDQKVAEEAAAWERVEAECWEREAVELHRQEEAECWEREENECQEKEENECQEREENECQEQEAQAWVASQVEGGGSQSCDSVHQQRGHRVRGGHKWITQPVPGVLGLRSTALMYKLAKAKQCMPAGTKKVQKCIVPAESTSPRASEKKKHAWAKSPEVEVVGGSSQAKKGKSVTCNILITGGLYAITTVIDWHTEEMVQLQQMVKMLGSLHCHMIKSMVELLLRDDISRAGVAH